ncbi:hypothetical protein L596_017014 [Steinernema carpocapsae]|uniref:Serine protease K12H4.7 n=1 Tax=Steinernema carpocapsae TaxID=34508 RepID=A0A4U5N0G2_STECR|nr:hypothetical protein L596_017014 [Steinernema carpocapsae]
MNGRVTVLLLLLVGCALSASLNKGSTGFNRKRWLIHGRPWHGLVPLPAAHDASKFPDQWFTQPLDNFNASIKQTYQQRYWSNDQFYKPGGPIFIMLGGEGPESNGWVRAEGLEWVTLAKKFNAMLYLIEHRFYGESQPYGKLISIDGYQYLSSRQALADMANFIKAKNAEMKYENPKWIVFGGSYSGALAAWARQQYPELVYGSLASSAPIQAEVDFYQYLEVVEFAFSQVDAQCADSIHKQFVLLQKLMKTAAGRETVKVEMQVCERIDPHTPRTSINSGNL